MVKKERKKRKKNTWTKARLVRTLLYYVSAATKKVENISSLQSVQMIAFHVLPSRMTLYNQGKRRLKGTLKLCPFRFSGVPVLLPVKLTTDIVCLYIKAFYKTVFVLCFFSDK